MKYFTIKEMCDSPTAKELGIDNTPTQDIEEHLQYLVENLLDPIREMWGKPINVNSGYRCEPLNKAVGGAKTSQHLQGYAADLFVGSRTANKKLFEMIKQHFLFDQLINEKNFLWVHVSLHPYNNRKQVLKA